MRKPLAMLLLSAAAFGETKLVSVGDHELAISCSGTRVRATVILAAGAGRTLADWHKVEPEVAKFTRVCSYDRAGLGESGLTLKTQTVEEILVDLHALLTAAGEQAPFVMAGHSLAGIHVRQYASKYPAEVSGLVSVDGSHEEQYWRAARISSVIAPHGIGTSDGFLMKPGELLQWRTTVPLIVLVHGQQPKQPLPGVTQKQLVALLKMGEDLQLDLAKRSPKGELRHAMQSGHFMQLDQPDVVIEAIRDVWQQSR